MVERMRPNGNAAPCLDLPDRLEKVGVIRTDVEAAVGVEQLSERLVHRLHDPLADQQLRNVRAVAENARKRCTQLLIADVESGGAQIFDRLPVAVLFHRVALCHKGGHFVKDERRQKQTQQMQLLTGKIGRKLRAADGVNRLARRRSGKARAAGDRIVVGQRDRAEPALQRQPDEFFGRQGAVRAGRMCMQIAEKRACVTDFHDAHLLFRSYL